MKKPMHPEIMFAQMEQEALLAKHNITDEADAMAQIAINLALFFGEGNIERYLDMPYTTAILLVSEINKQAKEAKKNAR